MELLMSIIHSVMVLNPMCYLLSLARSFLILLFQVFTASNGEVIYSRE